MRKYKYIEFGASCKLFFLNSYSIIPKSKICKKYFVKKKFIQWDTYPLRHEEIGMVCWKN